MHPILSQELLRALQHEMNERVGRPRAPCPASRKRWHRRTR